MNVIQTVRRKALSAAKRANKYLPLPFLEKSDAPVVAVCAYRSKNAHFVETMIGQLPSRTDVRLHALDSIPPSLADKTVGQGKLLRTDALKSLLESSPIPEDGWVVIFDDDATFARSAPSKFLDIAKSAGLDLAGPAIEVGQPFSHDHTQVRPASVARTVQFVEIGPVVAMSPRAVQVLLPLPEDFGMGWGLDVEWTQAPNITRGYVDATPILHHGKVGASYNSEVERKRLEEILESYGLQTITELLGWKQSWRPWERRAPWLASAER